MPEEVKELTIKEADEFIKKKVIGVLIKADVTIIVNELEAIYGDSLANGTVGDSFYIYNCPENYDESDYEELEYIDYDDMYDVTEEEILPLIDKTVMFISKMEDLLTFK